MSAGSSLVFLGLALAAGAFGGAGVLRRLGESGPSCALVGVSGAAALAFGVLAVLPSPPAPPGAMLPLIAAAPTLGVGWTTDTASMRLPHTVSNTMLAAVAWASAEGWLQAAGSPMPLAGVLIAVSLAPAAAGAAFAAPTTRTVWLWHSGGLAALAAAGIAAALDGGTGRGPLAVLAVTLAVLAGGWLLVWAGQAGAGDPVWVAACTTAAASHAAISAGGPLPGLEALAVASMGASAFLAVGGSAALLLAVVSARGRKPASRQPVLAGQWTALGLVGFAAVWKLTPLGPAAGAGWLPVG